MGHNHNGVSLKEYLKYMDEQLAMIKKKRDEIKEREKWQIHEKNIELKELICVGSFCSVHKGVYRNDKESIDVAVKVFEWGEESKETERVATSRKTFLREVSIWHNLEHPNIAKMIGGIYNAAGCYGAIERFENNGLVVMNYILRGNLKSYIIEHSKIKIPFDVVMKFALGLARGLNYLHSKKIVHRNVKPENILLDEKLNVKLSNFKVACFEPEYPKRENNFDESAVVKADSYCDTDTAMNHYKLTGVTGTMGYMAPEVYRKDPYDHKCDVYSFGMCLWEMYCCEEIISGYMFKYESFRPRVPRCCPKSFGKVIVKCWEPEPEKRPEMSEILRLLEDIDISKGKGMTPEESLSLFSCAMARLMKI